MSNIVAQIGVLGQILATTQRRPAATIIPMAALRPFTEHPASVGETYAEHCGTAVYFGARMIFAGCACLVHGLLPFAFVRTGSRAITELHERMITKRCAAPPAPLPRDSRLPL